MDDVLSFGMVSHLGFGEGLGATVDEVVHSEFPVSLRISFGNVLPPRGVKLDGDHLVGIVGDDVYFIKTGFLKLVEAGRVIHEYHVLNGRLSLRSECMLARFQKAGGTIQ